LFRVRGFLFRVAGGYVHCVPDGQAHIVEGGFQAGGVATAVSADGTGEPPDSAAGV
jgi:hypothetical protein